MSSGPVLRDRGRQVRSGKPCHSLLLAAWLLLNSAMIPVLVLGAGLDGGSCLVIGRDWLTRCGAALGDQGIRWLVFKWSNIALLVGLVVALVIAFAGRFRPSRAPAKTGYSAGDGSVSGPNGSAE